MLIFLLTRLHASGSRNDYTKIVKGTFFLLASLCVNSTKFRKNNRFYRFKRQVFTRLPSRVSLLSPPGTDLKHRERRWLR